MRRRDGNEKDRGLAKGKKTVAHSEQKEEKQEEKTFVVVDDMAEEKQKGRRVVGGRPRATDGRASE